MLAESSSIDLSEPSFDKVRASLESFLNSPMDGDPVGMIRVFFRNRENDKPQYSMEQAKNLLVAMAARFPEKQKDGSGSFGNPSVVPPHFMHLYSEVIDDYISFSRSFVNSLKLDQRPSALDQIQKDIGLFKASGSDAHKIQQMINLYLLAFSHKY